MSNSRTSRRDENLACKLSRNHYHLSGRGLLLAAAARALLALALGAAASLGAALALASLAGGSATAAFGGHDDKLDLSCSANTNKIPTENHTPEVAKMITREEKPTRMGT